jgi:hypothetical protein
MSAVPKKKLCWNCEGNVSNTIDNCPYCGVYLHSNELDEDYSSWNPSYRPSSKTEEIPSPLYQGNHKEEEREEQEEQLKGSDWDQIFGQLKKDIFPIFFLMAGSVFFLFGIILLLFSKDGHLTLQWESHTGYYFLAFAIPAAILGWNFFQQSEEEQ